MIMKPLSSSDILLLCRPEFTDTLSRECRARVPQVHEIESPEPGLLRVKLPDDLALPEFIFERQRLLSPGFVPASSLKPIGDEVLKNILGLIAAEHPLWTVHLMSVERDDDEDASFQNRMDGIWNTILRQGKKIAPDIDKRFRPPHRLKSGGFVLQLLLSRDGLWHSCEAVDSMINRHPGGFIRMKWDPLAPSRSYLKMEEALDRLDVLPAVGDKVIDLGAAPGGWTFSFLKRGCEVIAVDHGPMKLPPDQDGWGSVQHKKENGITYQPPADWTRVDWLVADMLIAPGVALGLLRRWLDSGKASCIICNIKLPQVEPFESIRPIQELLDEHPEYHSSIKQLYHDRREVTVMAKRTSWGVHRS